MRFPMPRSPLFRVARATAIALLLAAMVSAPRPAAADALTGPIEARVLRVIDGDSLQVRARIWLSQEVETVVRLDGIDAPELRGRCDLEKERARDARSFLEQRVAAADNTVLLRDIMQDKYGGRVLAKVQGGDGTDFAEALAAAGLVRFYAGGKREPWCPN